MTIEQLCKEIINLLSVSRIINRQWLNGYFQGKYEDKLSPFEFEVSYRFMDAIYKLGKIPSENDQKSIFLRLIDEVKQEVEI